jgi:hypothetical protein
VVYGLDKLDNKFSIDNDALKEEMQAMQISLEYISFYFPLFSLTLAFFILDVVHQTPFREIVLIKVESW